MQVPTVKAPQALTPSYNAVKIDINNPQANSTGAAPQSAQASYASSAYGVPNYNAVKIDINNPQANSSSTQQPVQDANYTSSVYEVPQASVYDVPQKSVYGPQQGPEVPPTVKEQPNVPAPVIVPAAVNTAPVTSPVVPVAPAPVEAISAAAPVKPQAPAQPASAPATAEAPAAAPQIVDVKSPEAATPKLDVNAFISKLSGDNYDDQATTMETIADMAQNTPDKATELLDTKVMESLLGIMNKDTSKLAGPSPKQLEIREKIMNNKPVSDAEKAEANAITPMEQAERNKQYAIYTVAILQKLFGSEVEKMNNAVVPLTELPGAAGVVEQVKNNPNPMVRAAGLDALSYVQRPEYKQDLNTIFTIAQKDKDPMVQAEANKGLEKLAQLQASQAAPAAQTPAAPPATEAKPEEVKPQEQKAVA